MMYDLEQEISRIKIKQEQSLLETIEQVSFDIGTLFLRNNDGKAA